jgi:hypothetical protein
MNFLKLFLFLTSFLLASIPAFDVSVEELGAGFGFRLGFRIGFRLEIGLGLGLGLEIVLVDVGYLDIATA